MDYQKIEESFNKQGLMKTLNAKLVSVKKGEVIIESHFSKNLTQQHNFFHAGVATSIVDSACGYAALTTAADNYDVLTVEFKVNFLKPAKTNKLVAIGKVIQAGKTLVVCDGVVYNETQTKLIAKMTATIMKIEIEKVDIR